jgi:hypothetical protein
MEELYAIDIDFGDAFSRPSLMLGHLLQFLFLSKMSRLWCLRSLWCAAPQGYLFNELLDHLSLLFALLISNGHLSLQSVHLTLQLINDLRVTLPLPCATTGEEVFPQQEVICTSP